MKRSRVVIHLKPKSHLKKEAKSKVEKRMGSEIVEEKRRLGVTTIPATDIPFATHTWNLVYGCLMGCAYCYARQMAKRIAGTVPEYSEEFDKLNAFEPTWIEKNWLKNFPIKPAHIFVDSMSDIFYWKRSWMNRALARIAHNPKHRFYFISKRPEVFANYDFPSNCILGTSGETPGLIKIRQKALLKYAGDHMTIILIEPMLEKVDPSDVECDKVNAIFVGPKRGKIGGRLQTMKKEWYEPWRHIKNAMVRPHP